MASRIHFPSLPPSIAVLPFLFMPSRKDDRDWDFNAALASAIAAERAVGEQRNTRRRLAYLLAELGAQYGRRVGDFSQAVPLSRSELARALGVSLCRVKRILALLALSQVIESDGASVRIVDWRRLCSMGGYDIGRLGFELPEEEIAGAQEAEPASSLTAGGDPACFA